MTHEQIEYRNYVTREVELMSKLLELKIRNYEKIIHDHSSVPPTPITAIFSNPSWQQHDQD